MMRQFQWETPEEIDFDIAQNAKRLRKRLGISRQKLSEISGVSYGSIKRFETSGNISLVSLTKIAIALDDVGSIKRLFSEVPYKSIEEVINEQE